jgi:hypothetical protein
MSEFKRPPVMVLTGVDDLKAALTNPSWFSDKRSAFEVKSVWLIALIDEIVASGQFPYNQVVQLEAEKRLGIDAQPENGSPMSYLVYNAQCYRRSDALIAAGFVPGSEAHINQAHAEGLQIECKGGQRLKTREVHGRIYAFQPRKRVMASNIVGYPVRLVDGKGNIVALKITEDAAKYLREVWGAESINELQPAEWQAILENACDPDNRLDRELLSLRSSKNNSSADLTSV